MLVWGTDPFCEADNVTDTVAVTYGMGIRYIGGSTVTGGYMIIEMVVFPDGSTLVAHGLYIHDLVSTPTILGGSGIYLGARGTETIERCPDGSLCTKTFDIWLVV